MFRLQVNSVGESEHLEIIQQGLENGNEWRAGKPDLRPDLRHVDLNRAYLAFSTTPQIRRNSARKQHCCCVKLP
jgi:hypothetical protein